MEQGNQNGLPLDGPKAIYEQYLIDGEFKIQYCENCGKHVFYPRAICPHCSSTELKWVTPSGKGVVYSTTTTHQSPKAGGNFNISLVDLEEGPRVFARVENIAPEEIFIGMQVEAFVSSIDDHPVVLFRPLSQ